MGDLVELFDDLEEFEIAAPNCPTCLHPMEPSYYRWTCVREHP